MVDQKKCQQFTTEKLKTIEKNDDSLEVFRCLVDRESKFSDVSFDLFESEYVAVHQGLACHAWLNVCDQDGVTETEIQKVFLKQIMDGFESPDALILATAFSEYWSILEHEESENPKIIGLAQKFLHRLQVTPEVMKAPKEGEISPCFKALVEILDGIRVVYENEFEGFLLENHG